MEHTQLDHELLKEQVNGEAHTTRSIASLLVLPRTHVRIEEPNKPYKHTNRVRGRGGQARQTEMVPGLELISQLV
jgi:hypothetical protein